MEPAWDKRRDALKRKGAIIILKILIDIRLDEAYLAEPSRQPNFFLFSISLHSTLCVCVCIEKKWNEIKHEMRSIRFWTIEKWKRVENIKKAEIALYWQSGDGNQVRRGQRATLNLVFEMLFHIFHNCCNRKKKKKSFGGFKKVLHHDFKLV